MNDQIQHHYLVDVDNLFSLKEKAYHWLRIPHPKKLHMQSGQYISKHKGAGLDFNESRPYNEGDDIRHIDWRITARSGKAYTKVYHEERERPISILCDQSSSMFFGSQKQFKSVLAARLSMMITWLSLQNGDKVSFNGWGAQHSFTLPLQRKTLAGSLIAKQLSAISPTKLCENTNAFSFNDALKSFSRSHGHHLFIVSDFYHLDSQCIQTLNHLARHHQLVFVHVFDNIEIQPPKKGTLPFSYKGKTHWFQSTKSSQQLNWQQTFEHRQLRIKQFCAQHKVSYLPANCLDNELDILQSIQHWWTL
ncbi:DUF58 domain-containing protein [Marinicellulosiphila megalodicopiae]|uniref:DUF58 domain-containing protein n=1 Tax=Marinicellulosiphila megalodicopiae TaxID=2724896 RepID=UPI003BAFC7E4